MRTRLLAALVVVVVGAGCGAKTGLDLEPSCESERDCPTADWCGAVPVCVFGRCEAGPARDCSDGTVCTNDACDGVARACTHVVRDRDGDGFGDASCGGDDCDDADPAVHPGAHELCTGGRDEDCDGHYDCSDSDCFGDPACRGCTRELCTGGRDEDCDTLVDCVDPDCAGDPACCTPTETRCTNARDDDCDGLVDCLDPDCARDPACCEPHPEVCNGVDDDCDGVADDGLRCYYADDVLVQAVVSTTCGPAWYAYGSPAAASANPVPDVRTSGAVVLAVQEGPASCGGATVALIADEVSDGTGGTLVGNFDVTPAGVAGVLVSDDPHECSWDATRARATCAWRWQPCCTDGVLLGTFAGDFCVTATVSSPSGVSGLLVYDGPGRTLTRSFGTPVRLCGRSVPLVP